MSYYYNYFLGYKNNDDGLFYPLGPYDMNGTLHDVISRSRSFASNLHEKFYCIPKDKYSDKLKEEFEYKDYTGEKCIGDVRWLPLSELPHGNYIRKGYFLIRDIEAYERSMREDGFASGSEYFYECIPCEIYAQMMQNELTFGKPEQEFDCEGEEIETHSCREYAFYMYPDYESEEYEASTLRDAIGMYEYGVKELDNAQIVILETEG